jgi:hypothetical protein
VDAALKRQQRVGEEVAGAEKIPAHADPPGGRRDIERQRSLDLVQQVERKRSPTPTLHRMTSMG